MEKADLHIHSLYSDGLLSPEQIIDWGIKKRLKALSITDHDTIDGIGEAIKYSRDKDIQVLPGIELSTEYYNNEVHILGYYIDYSSADLLSFLDKLKESRAGRAELMVKKLSDIGININISDIYSEAGNGVSLGRPHVARVLVNKGYCVSIEEAFDKFLGKGRSAYVERYKISPFEAVNLISKYNGVSSLAHPGLIHNVNTTELIKRLKSFGLDAVEVYHSSHSAEDADYFYNLANQLSLIPTGGTDCHGIMYDSEPMLGNIYVPYENILKLHEKVII